MKRILYLFAMYTGARAVFNKARSFSLPGLRTEILDGETLQIDKSYLIRVRVHGRPSAKILGSENNAGMISIHLISPGISRLSYALLRLTSHFGCGHVEIAFYETHDSVICFAIRNILRSNIDRLRLGKLFRNLKLSSDNDEIVLLQDILQELNDRGVGACLASPDECVSLAVNKTLLNPKNCHRVIEALRRRYKRISKRIAMNNNALHTELRVARLLEVKVVRRASVNADVIRLKDYT